MRFETRSSGPSPLSHNGKHTSHMNEPATTESTRTHFICGERAVLPARLVEAARVLAVPSTVQPYEIQAEPVCTLEEHVVGAHWGFVRDLDGPNTGSVWTPWTAGRGPDAVVVLPDCAAVSGDAEPCGEFAAHPGAHSWELRDRPEDPPKVQRAEKGKSRVRVRPRRLRQEPESVTWAREKAGLTKRALADLVGISEQLMGEIESGWRSATPANLRKIAGALNCPLVSVERKRPQNSQPTSTTTKASST